MIFEIWCPYGKMIKLHHCRFRSTFCLQMSNNKHQLQQSQSECLMQSLQLGFKRHCGACATEALCRIGWDLVHLAVHKKGKERKTSHHGRSLDVLRIRPSCSSGVVEDLVGWAPQAVGLEMPLMSYEDPLYLGQELLLGGECLESCSVHMLYHCASPFAWWLWRALVVYGGDNSRPPYARWLTFGFLDALVYMFILQHSQKCYSTLFILRPSQDC